MSDRDRKLKKSRLARLAAFGVALLALGGGCQQGGAAGAPSVFQGISLTDQNGAAVPQSALAQGPLLVGFMFTSCPVVCPEQTRALAEVRAALPSPVRERVRFLSVSVDPENDSPAALKRFAREQHADTTGWSFVRSDEAGTQLLTSRLATFEPGTAPAPSAHSTSLYLFDRGGRLVQRYRGAPLDVSHLARELVLLDDVKPTEARLARN